MQKRCCSKHPLPAPVFAFPHMPHAFFDLFPFLSACCNITKLCIVSGCFQFNLTFYQIEHAKIRTPPQRHPDSKKKKKCLPLIKQDQSYYPRLDEVMFQDKSAFFLTLPLMTSLQAKLKLFRCLNSLILTLLGLDFFEVLSSLNFFTQMIFVASLSILQLLLIFTY